MMYSLTAGFAGFTPYERTSLALQREQLECTIKLIQGQELMLKELRRAGAMPGQVSAGIQSMVGTRLCSLPLCSESACWADAMLFDVLCLNRGRLVLGSRTGWDCST